MPQISNSFLSTSVSKYPLEKSVFSLCTKKHKWVLCVTRCDFRFIWDRKVFLPANCLRTSLRVPVIQIAKIWQNLIIANTKRKIWSVHARNNRGESWFQIWIFEIIYSNKIKDEEFSLLKNMIFAYSMKETKEKRKHPLQSMAKIPYYFVQLRNNYGGWKFSKPPFFPYQGKKIL